MMTGRSVRQSATLAGLLLAAATAFAQQPGGVPMPNGPPNPIPQAPANQAAVGSSSDQTNFQRMDEQDFVRNILHNDEAQLRLSRLAEQKSSSPDLKQFSGQMLKVYSELDNQFAPAAKQLGVDQPKAPSKKEKKEIANMQALSGPQFDAAYLEAMAREQQQILKRFRDESRNNTNTSLAQAAKADTPVLARNFQVLQKIAQAHNVEIESSKK